MQFVIESLEMVKEWSLDLKERGYVINTVIIFIIDNVSSMNEVDWKFYLELINNPHPVLQNLVILMNAEKKRQYIKPWYKASISKMGLVINKTAHKFYET